MAAPYRIRPATVDDVGFLADVSLAAASLPADFDEVEWRTGFGEWTVETLADTFVVEVSGDRAGRLRIRRTSESIELCGIQLLPEVQNRGVGTAIIRELQTESAGAGVPLDLGVEKDNHDARRLYDRLGFTQIGVSDNEDKLRWLDRKVTAVNDKLWDAETAQRYDTPGTGMFAPEVLGPTVDRLAELAGDGRALEFAIGTGRVAVPLAERGVPVTGIELSQPMVDQLRTKVDEATIPVVMGDMATDRGAGRVHAGLPRLQHHLQPADPGRAGRVLPQRRPPPRARRPLRRSSSGCPSCASSRRAAGHGLHQRARLHRAGHLRRAAPAGRLAPLHVRRGHGRRGSPAARTATSGRPSSTSWPSWPGSSWRSRHADWSGTEFTADSRSHVSVYRL